ncbi:MAG: DUF1992 domain-containing protein [Anaerolineae bacterium]|nr:DUF1992 domain-containing protein [Anaerolineae bacterium]MCO5192134.1 DUF1992 domain-containing protein [Anaerolineae bacterium]MCO5196340.1 DUF1992 domain-containing protein [Anaerolineae bacterium]
MSGSEHQDLNGNAAQPQDEEISIERRKSPRVPLTVFESVVEKQIQEAQERGEFDDLPGAGEPIKLDTNVYAGDNELAYKMLKDNDFTLPWIADRNEVTEAIAILRSKMAYQYKLVAPEIRAMARADHVALARQRWDALLADWGYELRLLNAQIDDTNLLLPVRNLEILRLTLDAELKRLGATRDVQDQWVIG